MNENQLRKEIMVTLKSFLNQQEEFDLYVDLLVTISRKYSLYERKETVKEVFESISKRINNEN